jgi:hypothetical protein
MKNTTKIFIIVLAAVLALAGCKKKEADGGNVNAGKIDKIEVNLSTLPLTINAQEFPNTWADLAIKFPKWPDNIDWAYLNRIRVNVKYYYDDMDEIEQQDGMAMVSLIYDVDDDWRGPEMGPGPNTPLKQFNLGGGSGNIHTEEGSRLFLDKAPGMILFQNSNVNVAYIEVTEITFFRAE